MQEEMKVKSLRESFSETLNVMGAVGRCLSMPAEPFLLSSPGSERYGIYALAAFFGMLGIAQNLRDIVLWRFAWVWLAVLLLRRIEVAVRWYRGQRQHSRYEGDPWLVGLLRLRRLGWLGNPLLCGVIGWALTGLSVNLGKVWWAAGGAMTFLSMTNAALDAARMRAMDDARIEMEWAARGR